MSGKRFKLIPEMEGRTARWYAKQRGTQSQLELYRRQARELTQGLPPGARVLEIAPGPGYLSVELARLGAFEVQGVDISHTFVEIATENARQAGVNAQFQQGDAAHLPFADATFDLVVSQAAFKNFTEPLRALNEIHRVLKPGGQAIIKDMNKESSAEELDREVRQMKLSRFNTFTTKLVLGTMLRRRAYRPAELLRLAGESAFGGGEIRTEGIGLELRLKRAARVKAA